MRKPKIVVKNLTKYFGDKKVLDNISFEVYEGEIFGLLGHNGAGKTTTLRIIAGIIENYDGSVETDGKIGYLPEERGLYRDEKVFDVLKFFGKLAGVEGDKLVDSINYWLNKLKIQQYKNFKVKELSKGNQQKVQFIVAVIHDPDILILDEPFSGLDVANVNLLKNIILELKEKGKTIILSTHQLEKIEKLCDRILILKKGKAIHYGTIENICRKMAYIEYLENGKIVKKELPYKDALNILKENLEHVVKFEVRYSLEELFLVEE
ncbi:ABC transporter releated protein [Methanocaldococcus vulcanius M7]|uniref:ABC transporter releated protein n=1 Tax=Methanocaldococcus vulcanius (strain ATCC 700851 / DSM 12094 / M7) TaxID=579137 RepID=C9RFX4_METVM|nr:ATP-binding cassette domain-containing protein [Methanocaldococcus vulcanius]ACX72476.1 ABC transporter releated protein [Methanocaldococcus vulcanius M7]